MSPSSPTVAAAAAAAAVANHHDPIWIRFPLSTFYKTIVNKVSPNILDNSVFVIRQKPL